METTRQRLKEIYHEYTEYLRDAIDDKHMYNEIVGLWTNDFHDRLSAMGTGTSLTQRAALVKTMQDFFHGAFEFLDGLYVYANTTETATPQATIIAFEKRAHAELQSRLSA